MIEALFLLLSFLKAGLRSQTELALENLALQQPLAILKRNRAHPALRRRDRLFRACLSHFWQKWRESLIVAKSETVIRWHRRGFAFTWGSPGIHGELLKLGIKISERTVARLMPKRRNSPPQTWRAFLDNHVEVGGRHHHYERRAA